MIEISDDKDAKKRARELIKRLKQTRSQQYMSEDSGVYASKVTQQYENSMKKFAEEDFLRLEKQKQLEKQSEIKKENKLKEEQKLKKADEFLQSLKAYQYQNEDEPVANPEEIIEDIKLPKIKISKHEFNKEEGNSIKKQRKRPKSPLIKQIIQEDKKLKQQHLIEKLQKREFYMKKKEYSQQVLQNFVPKSKYEQDYYRNKFVSDLDQEMYGLRTNKRTVQPIEQLLLREEKIQQLLSKDKNYTVQKQRGIENSEKVQQYKQEKSKKQYGNLEEQQDNYQINEELKQKMSHQEIIEMVYAEKKQKMLRNE